MSLKPTNGIEDGIQRAKLPEETSRGYRPSRDYGKRQKSSGLSLAPNQLPKYRTKDGAFHGRKAKHINNDKGNPILESFKICVEKRNLRNACLIHTDVVARGLDIQLSPTLIAMYADFGALEEAEDVFNELLVQNIASWNALIGGYVQHRQYREALNCFKQMQDDALIPNATTFAYLLKACGSLRSLTHGKAIHTDMKRHRLLGENPALDNALLDMYVRCGALDEAKSVFDGLLKRNIMSWNSLITGYTQHGYGDEALAFFKMMQEVGVSPDGATFASILKACGIIRSVGKGENIHVHVREQGLLEKDLVLGNALVDMYAKCGQLEKAQDVFDKLPARNIVTWNALIGGYAQHGLDAEALKCFQKMKDDDIYPNSVTFVCILKTCGSVKLLEMGKEIHAEVRKQGLLKKNVMVGTAVLDMYAKCGLIAKAQSVFDELKTRDTVCWNALINGYVQHHLYEEALNLFQRMQDYGMLPDAVTYIFASKACANLGFIEKGEEIYCDVKKRKLLEKNVVLGNSLIDMYAKCGAFEKAQVVFDELHVRSTVSWNALIAGFTEHGFHHEALNWFKKMQNEGLLPDEVTYACILKACANTMSLQKGEEIHAEIKKLGLLEKNHLLGTTLVDMYVKCGLLGKAQDVFDELLLRDVSSWTALIVGYVQHGLIYEALYSYEKMKNEGIHPDGITFSCILKGCGSLGLINKGKEVHAMVQNQGFIEKSILLGTSLVDMYAKCGNLTKAQDVFDGLIARDVVSWNALIAGYAQNDLGYEALKCFEQMQSDGFSPDVVTFASVLKACTNIRAIEKGEKIHAELQKQRLLENNVVLGSVLVDLYAKCGLLLKAQDIFDELPVWDIVSWNALISGYAQVGQVEQVFASFNIMISQDTIPDIMTFVALLSTCSHAGLVVEGEMYFSTMRTVYCLTPVLEHYTCMVDLFSRAGHFQKALCLIRDVPSSDCFPLWSSLLSGCHKWLNVDVGKLAFEELIKLDEEHAPAYVLMSNLYAAVGMQEEAHDIELLMKNMNIKAD